MSPKTYRIDGFSDNIDRKPDDECRDNPSKGVKKEMEQNFLRIEVVFFLFFQVDHCMNVLLITCFFFPYIIIFFKGVKLLYEEKWFPEHEKGTELATVKTSFGQDEQSFE